MKLHIFKYFKDKSCYDKVRKNANRSTTTESTTIEKNISTTKLATTGRPLPSTEFTTVESIHSTRQDNATSNRDKEYVIKQFNLLNLFYCIKGCPAILNICVDHHFLG